MDGQTLALFAGALLTLAGSYIPSFSVWYAGLDSTRKSLIMGGALVLVSVLIFAAGCGNLGLPFDVTCDKKGLVGLASTLLYAVMANVGLYVLLPQTMAVRAAIAARDFGATKVTTEVQ